MHQELLLGLLGIPGDIFMEVSLPKDDETTVTISSQPVQMQLPESLPFIHPGELDSLQKLLTLANSYSTYQHFIAPDNRPPGLYRHSICDALDQLLEKYREDVELISEKVLETPQLPVSYLVHSLDRYFRLFPALDQLVTELLTSKRSHGCPLLDILERFAMSGEPAILSSFQILSRKLHAVFYRQLATWCLHGILMDQHAEFFVSPLKTSHKTKPTLTINDAVNASGSSNSASNEADESDTQLDSTVVNQEEQRFEIIRPLLPTCVSQRLAEKILFIGESVYRFSSHYKQSFSQAKFANPSNPSFGESFRPKELIQGQEDSFMRELLSIEKDSQFWKRKLEVLLDGLHSTVNRAVSHLFVEERDLVTQLRRIRDFYLLGRGELFLSILDTIHQYSKENKDFSKIDPNSIFNEVLIQLKCENSAQSDFLKFSLCRKSIGDLGSEKLNQIAKLFNAIADENDVLNDLSISCTVDWPLRVLLTPTILNQYEALFRFLLHIKCSQWKLYQIWRLKRGFLTQNPSPHIDRQRLARDFTDVWEVHHKMRFFTDCLQYYIFFDIIEVQYNFLIEKIRSTDNFDAILLAHQQFLAEVMNKLFFNNFHIFNAIFQVLRLIERFYSTQLGQHSIAIWELSHIRDQFNHCCIDFFTQFNEDGAQNPNFGMLLLRIDFNGFYTNNVKDMLSKRTSRGSKKPSSNSLPI